MVRKQEMVLGLGLSEASLGSPPEALKPSLRPSGGEDWELLQESDGCSLNQQSRCQSLER